MRQCWDCDTTSEWADLDDLWRCSKCRATDPVTTVDAARVNEPDLDW